MITVSNRRQASVTHQSSDWHRQQNVAVWSPLGVLLILLLWEAWSRVSGHPALVPPTVFMPALVKLLLSGQLWPHVVASLWHVLLGFGLAVVLGFSVGVLLTLSERFRAAALPVIDGIRGVSAISLFPLIILLLGLGLASKAFVIFWTAWPAVLLNTVSGIGQIDRSLIEAASLDTSSRWAITRRVAVPLALPTIITGLRIALSGGWISLTAAEMLGGNQGLGYFVLQSSQTFHFTEMYAGIMTIALVGYGLSAALLSLQNAIDKENRA